MGKGSGPRERLRWEAGKKPAAMENWSATLARDVRGGLPAYRLGLILPPLFHSTRGICWMTRKRLAEVSGVSISSVRDGLRELEELGHIGRSLEVIGGKRKRTIFPTICHEVAAQARRVRRGGVAKGIDPAAIAAEKRRNTASAPQDRGMADVIEAEAERIILPSMPPAAAARLSVAQHEKKPEPEAWSAVHTPGSFHAWQIHTKFSDLLLHPPQGSITAETVKAAQIAWRDGWFIAWAEEFCGGDRRARPIWWMTDYESQRRPKPTAVIEEEQSPPMIGCASPGCSSRASVVCGETRAPYCMKHRGFARGRIAAQAL